MYKSATSYNNSSTSSILISAKNEEDNIPKILPKIIRQEGINEIIVLDDFSKDSTEEKIRDFQPQVMYHKVTTDAPGKKIALTEGVHLASHESILVTDADCVPASDHWARIMTGCLNQKKQIVLGYGAYKKIASVLNSFVRFETATTAIQYFSYSLFGLSYMGVGRNMSFSKTLFQKTGGYQKHLDVASGDDDLFIRDAATSHNVAICLNKKSFTYSIPPLSLNEYIGQKLRHISTSFHYNHLTKILLSIHPFFYLLAFVSGILLISLGNWKFVAVLFLLRWATFMLFGFYPFKLLGEKDLVLKLPFLDLCWIPYYIMLSILSYTSQPKSW